MGNLYLQFIYGCVLGPRAGLDGCGKSNIYYIYYCVQIVYELLLQSNDTASETFLHKSGTVRSVDWIFIIGAPAWR